MQQQRRLELRWTRHPTGRWSRIRFIDPNLANVEGVWVIWQEGRTSTLEVGQDLVSDGNYIPVYTNRVNSRDLPCPATEGRSGRYGSAVSGMAGRILDGSGDS